MDPSSQTHPSSFRLKELDNRVSGRLALVTGSSGGIGGACARALASEGCDVALHFCSNQAAVQALAEDLTSKYPAQSFTIHQADLSQRESTRGLIDSVLQVGSSKPPKHQSISILILNAALGRRIRDVKEIECSDWDEMLEVNCTNQFILIKTCLDSNHGKMRQEQWGRIILIGSISSKGAGINGCHYAASKGALSAMGLNLARLLAPDNITVNIISPGAIGGTGMIPSAKSTVISNSINDDLGLKIASMVPLGRLGDPSEVGNVIQMIVKTGYLTGQDIILSAGLH